MRLELESNTPAISPVNSNHSTDQEKFAEHLNAGIRAAQAGDRKAARRNLMAALDIDSQSESVWLWLASISEYPEELLVFLNNVLDINPQNERALQWSSSTKVLLSKTLVQRGVDANENGRRDFAIQCFDQALSYDKQNVSAWLWLAALSESAEMKMEYFHRVLEIEPDNETARTAVEIAEAGSRSALFANAAWCAAKGDAEGSAVFLKQMLERWPSDLDACLLRSQLAVSFEEKKHCWRRVLELDPTNAFASAGLASLESIETAAKSANSEPSGEEPVPFHKSEVVEVSSNDVSVAVDESWQEQHAEDPVEEFSPQPAPLGHLEEVSIADQIWADSHSQNSLEQPEGHSTVDVVSTSPEEIQFVSNDYIEPHYDEIPSNEVVFSGYDTFVERTDVDNDPFGPFAEPVSSEPEPVPMPFQPIQSDGRLKIMVVESNATARKLMAGKLENSGYNVICAESGHEAMDMVFQNSPTLVLAAIAMPGMDGYAFCRTLRDQPQTQGLPVILISGKDAYYDEDLGQVAGASGFITKPFGPETLMKTIESFITVAAPNT